MRSSVHTLRAIAWLAASLLTAVHSAEPLHLSLADAVSRALDYNLSAITSREAVQTAEGAEGLARARLLPNLTAGLTGTRQIIDLAAYGFPPPAGGSPLVGPFNVIDARLYLSQSVLDLQASEQRRAARFGEDAARSAAAAMRETVVVAAATLYLQAAADEKRIEAVREQVAAAQSLYEHAERLKDAGVVAGIEVLRAKVQLEAQRQRLIVAENTDAKDRLALARAIGLPLDQPFALSDGLVYRAAGDVSLEATLKDAEAAREDLKQTKSQLQEAEESEEHTSELQSLRHLVCR